MIGRLKKRLIDLKLNVKIRLYFTIIITCFCIVFVLVFKTLLKYNHEYNQIVQSATTASRFSIDFKKDFDYKMYRIIIGSKSFYEAVPYDDIKAAQVIAAELKDAARTATCRDKA
jgi:hypothetical protein